MLKRPEGGDHKSELTGLARKILKPQKKEDYLSGVREAAMMAPVVSEIYAHYRGEILPDAEFFDNALTDNYKIPEDKLKEFKSIFFDTLKTAKLLAENEGEYRVIDVSSDDDVSREKVQETFKKLEKSAKVSLSDSCFVMMPFSDPLGSYYEKIYKQAIE